MQYFDLSYRYPLYKTSICHTHPAHLLLTLCAYSLPQPAPLILLLLLALNVACMGNAQVSLNLACMHALRIHNAQISLNLACVPLRRSLSKSLLMCGRA